MPKFFTNENEIIKEEKKAEPEAVDAPAEEEKEKNPIEEAPLKEDAPRHNDGSDKE